jgi:hypothetical protein
LGDEGFFCIFQWQKRFGNYFQPTYCLHSDESLMICLYHSFVVMLICKFLQSIPTIVVEKVLVKKHSGILLEDWDTFHITECEFLRKGMRRSNEKLIGKGWYGYCKSLKLCQGDLMRFSFWEIPHIMVVKVIRGASASKGVTKRNKRSSAPIFT